MLIAFSLCTPRVRGLVGPPWLPFLLVSVMSLCVLLSLRLPRLVLRLRPNMFMVVPMITLVGCGVNLSMLLLLAAVIAISFSSL